MGEMGNIQEETATDKTVGTDKAQKAYADVDITDDFMFSYIMRNPDICIELLQYMFPCHKIQKVRYIYDTDTEKPQDGENAQASNTPQDDKTSQASNIPQDNTHQGNSASLKEASISPEIQKTLMEAFGMHGVRLDVYLDDGKAVYNVEMQNLLQRFLPKRTRYYHSEIDGGLLRRGEKYKNLKPCYVIFICKFDPFGEGLYKYTFSNRCHEVDGLGLGDEAYTLFFSTVGTKDHVKEDGTVDKISDRLKELLRYMNDTKNYPVGDSDNDLIKRIDAAVDEAKMDSEWRRAYMTYQARIWDAEDVGEERGIKKGEEKKARETAEKLNDMGLSIDQIVQAVSYPVDVVKKWLGLTPAKN